MHALPKDFLWGNSTSSMQTEGADQEDGKGKSVYSDRPATANASDWQVAIDEYHRYPEDIALMKAAGMNCYRFQISWSRVCPTGDGDFNEAGIAFYAKLIDDLLAAGITPMVCLYHFDMPLALAKQYNGFMSRHVVEAFVRYAKAMIDRFADKVPYWLTFNEQNLYFQPDAFLISGYDHGDRSLSDLYTINHHVMLAHATVANYLHATTHAQIGGMLAYVQTYPASPDPQDALYAQQIDEFLNRNQLDVFVNGHYSSQVLRYMANHDVDGDIQDADLAILAECHSDYIAFSYYQSTLIDSHHVPIGTAPNNYLAAGGLTQNPTLPANEWHWVVDPTGFRNLMTSVYNSYHTPMFPVENGLGVREQYDGKPINDDYRIAYHRAHLQALKAAYGEDGVPIIGYLGWGLIDIPSSSGNMDKRYGLVYVDRTNHDLRTLARIPKRSYEWFKQVTMSNGERLD